MLVAGCHSSPKLSPAATTSAAPAASAAPSAAPGPASAGASSVGASSVVSSAPDASSGAAAASNPDSVGPPVVAQVGAPVTYPDGLAIALLSAVRFTPGSTAQGMEAGDTAVRLQIRLTNGSKAAFDSSRVQVELFAGLNVDQAGPLTESTAASGPAPVAAGQSVTLIFEFAVPTADLPTISVTVTPNLTEADAMFTAQVTG